MADRNVNVTLKAGKASDSPWITVTGDSAEEVKRTLAQAVDLDLSTADNYSLAEVTVFASQALQGTRNVVADLGATPLDPEPTESGASGSEDGDGWAAAKAQRAGGAKPASDTAGDSEDTPAEPSDGPETDEDPVLRAIAQAPDKAALRRIWARHKKDWKPEYDEAAKARGEELE